VFLSAWLFLVELGSATSSPSLSSEPRITQRYIPPNGFPVTPPPLLPRRARFSRASAVSLLPFVHVSRVFRSPLPHFPTYRSIIYPRLLFCLLSVSILWRKYHLTIREMSSDSDRKERERRGSKGPGTKLTCHPPILTWRTLSLVDGARPGRTVRHEMVGRRGRRRR
jgi:hypothetical protein